MSPRLRARPRDTVKLKRHTGDIETGSFDLADAIIENELALMSALSQQPVFIAIAAGQFEKQPYLGEYEDSDLHQCGCPISARTSPPPWAKDMRTLPTEFAARLSGHLALVPVEAVTGVSVIFEAEVDGRGLAGHPGCSEAHGARARHFD